MAKILYTTGILLVLAINLNSSQSLRANLRTRQFFARQQTAPAVQPTGYPAAGITPETPFEEAPATTRPDSSYLPPDNTYGPPPPPAEEIPVAEPAAEDEPTPSPPAEDDEVVFAVGKDGTVIAVSTSFDEAKNGRLVNQRFPQARRSQRQPVPARLINKPSVEILPRFVAAPERFAYSVQVQQW